MRWRGNLVQNNRRARRVFRQAFISKLVGASFTPWKGIPGLAVPDGTPEGTANIEWRVPRTFIRPIYCKWQHGAISNPVGRVANQVSALSKIHRGLPDENRMNVWNEHRVSRSFAVPSGVPSGTASLHPTTASFAFQIGLYQSQGRLVRWSPWRSRPRRRISLHAAEYRAAERPVRARALARDCGPPSLALGL